MTSRRSVGRAFFATTPTTALTEATEAAGLTRLDVQTKWDSLLRPARGLDGRWTVDAWAPVDGRVINGGVRVGF